MGRRTNTAVWLPNQNRWQIKVQKDGVRKTFTSAKPGRTGQREANRKADLWLDEGISSTRLLVETAYVNWIAEVKMTTSQSNWKPIESRWRTWVQPDLGKKQVANLNEQMLQAVVNKAFAAGLSKKTLISLCADLRHSANGCGWASSRRFTRKSCTFPKAPVLKKRRYCSRMRCGCCLPWTPRSGGGKESRTRTSTPTGSASSRDCARGNSSLCGGLTFRAIW